MFCRPLSKYSGFFCQKKFFWGFWMRFENNFFQTSIGKFGLFKVIIWKTTRCWFVFIYLLSCYELCFKRNDIFMGKNHSSTNFCPITTWSFFPHSIFLSLTARVKRRTKFWRFHGIRYFQHSAIYSAAISHFVPKKEQVKMSHYHRTLCA